MDTRTNFSSAFRSNLSFRPLLKVWKEIGANDLDAASASCKEMVDRFSEHPELLEEIEDYKLLDQNKQLIRQAMNTIFPVSMSLSDQLYAAVVPFGNKVIFASPAFRNTFVDANSNYILPQDKQVEENIAAGKLKLAYRTILSQFYNIELPGGSSFICAYPDPTADIYNYFELEWDPQFVNIATSMDLPTLSEEFKSKCYHSDDVLPDRELLEALPLNQFVFEGIMIVYLRIVTDREAIQKIKQILQDETALTNTGATAEIEQQIRYLINMREVKVAITSFYNIEREISFTTVNHYTKLFDDVSEDNERTLSQSIKNLMDHSGGSYLWSPSNRQRSLEKRLNDYLEAKGWRTVFFAGLYNNDELIGCLGLFSKVSLNFDAVTLSKLKKVLELLRVALQQHHQHYQNQVNRLIKEHFTAVQESVEWKFHDAAVSYLSEIKEGKDAKMQPIIFDAVYPLYGIIDIRNSSGERNRGVQKDLLQQLNWVRDILLSAQQQGSFLLLDQLLARTEEYLASTTNFLFAADEQAIYSFLKSDVVELFKALKNHSVTLASEIHRYFNSIDRQLLIINAHRIQFEKSVTEINNKIVQFLEREQVDAQKIYPHYFERFVSDGVDFNMYVGQSISPHKKYSKVYLKNLRLWQLNFLATTAQHIHQLTPELPVPLDTTQLLLVYTDPISIGFRAAERKFDVEGVHFARYEVIKKRIDKAQIKNKNERLTQPGSIAIVYSVEQEANEYMQYIDFFQKRKLLSGPVEKLEIEELQGISGLKALRVPIVLQPEQDTTDETAKAKLKNTRK
jgi:hypothetical protein